MSKTSVSKSQYKPCQLRVGRFMFDAVSRNENLSARAKLVMVFLCQDALENADIPLSYFTIGQGVGVQKRHAITAILELEKFGLIEVVKNFSQNRRHSANSYVFLWHEIYQEQFDNFQA